jgi:hypothetical protein
MSRNPRALLITLNNELVHLTPYPWKDIATWSANALPIIRRDWPDYLEDFRQLTAQPRWATVPMSMGSDAAQVRATAASLRATTDSANKSAAEHAKARILSFLKGILTATSEGVAETAPLQDLHNLLDRFHVVARQLAQRHGNRPPLTITDEYDVQDLLHALLKLEFDDIRPEEWTPSYAGGCARMDFLLKEEQFVVEVKKTGSSLGAKEVGEQLLVDIAKYRQHSDCKTLVCFVYDPEHRIGNPVGLQRDLEEQSVEGLQVVVLIRPV